MIRVMEKEKNIWAVELKSRWSDLGSLDSLLNFLKEKDAHIMAKKQVLAGCKNAVVFSPSKLVVGIGIKDLIIVDTPDVLLAARPRSSREFEEVGYKAQHWQEIYNNDRNDLTCSLSKYYFTCDGLEKLENPPENPDSGEVLAYDWFSFDDIFHMINDGKILQDDSILVALSFLYENNS